MTRLPGAYSLQHAARLHPPRPRLRFRVSLLTGHWTLLGGHWSAELARRCQHDSGEPDPVADVMASVSAVPLTGDRMDRRQPRMLQLSVDL